MGAGLVTAAFEAAARVNADHAPVRAYVFMANRAVDVDSNPVYFGGRDALAGALGKLPDAGGHRAVARATAQLIDAGLIKVAQPHAPNRSTRLALLDGNGEPLRPIDRRHSPSTVPATGDTHRPVNRRHSPSEQVTLSAGTGDTHRPHQENEENKEEKTRPSPTKRTCTRHPNWDHTEPCRACGEDRRASQARPSTPSATMSPARADCGPGKHRWMPPERTGDRTCGLCPIQWRAGEEEP